MDNGKEDRLKRYTEKISDYVGFAYSDGYSAGYQKAKEEFGSHERGTAKCVRATAEQTERYGAELYGWCTECEKPIEGRWVFGINFCPWCGRVIEWKKDEGK